MDLGTVTSTLLLSSHTNPQPPAPRLSVVSNTGRMTSWSNTTMEVPQTGAPCKYAYRRIRPLMSQRGRFACCSKKIRVHPLYVVNVPLEAPCPSIELERTSAPAAASEPTSVCRLLTPGVETRRRRPLRRWLDKNNVYGILLEVVAAGNGVGTRDSCRGHAREDCL